MVEEKQTHLQRVSKCILKFSPITQNQVVSKYDDICNEVSILRSLSHENILKIYEVFEDDKHVNIITDFLPGGTLASKIISKTSYFT